MRKNMAAACMIAAVLGATTIARPQNPPATMPAAPNPAPVPAPAAKDADLPVKRVTLFSSGVGFFEHDGTIEGNAASLLRFEPPQINDVLKSLVVFDRDGGQVKNVTYPANNSASKTLKSFQVDLSENPSLADILLQMRGAAVAISVGDEIIEGTILGVESKEKIVGKAEDGKTVSSFTVNIFAPAGIRAVQLDEIRKLDVKDEKIKKELGQALAALAQDRDQSKRVVTVHFEGTGKRRVGMGYLVETPVWKTSYRLILPDPTSKDHARLQGWAIVENQTDNDWTDVSLSLVGGRPLGYIELLYQPIYNPRPVLKPDLGATVQPQTYDDGIAAASGAGGSISGRAAANITPPTYDLADITKGGSSTSSLFSDTSAEQAKPAPEKTPTDYSQGVASLAQTTKIGEMFHYDVDKVTLPRQQSSMIPIIADPIDCERLSIFNAAVLPTHALRGLRLTNKTGKYLVGGPLTVLDTIKAGTSYAGDAKIGDVPPGQSRLLSYAIDQELLIEVSKDQSGRAIVGGTVNKGMLNLHYRDRMQREYTLQNKGDSEKTVVVEHPITPGYDLKEPAKVVETTDTVYRIQVTVPAKGTQKVNVMQERTTAEAIAIGGLQTDAMAIYLQEGEIPQKVKDMLSTVAAKRDAVADVERQLKRKEAERSRILEEQSNIRDNIRVLPQASKTQQDAINDLAAHDADRKRVTKDINDLQDAADKARTDLANYLSTTVVE